MTDLSKRAVGLKGWRWLPGMLALPPKADRCQRDSQMMVGRLPDLTDPATLGCLLALVREAWGDEHLHNGRRIAGWGVWTSASTPIPQCVGKGDTEAEALVAALEAAERQEVSDD